MATKNIINLSLWNDAFWCAKSKPYKASLKREDGTISFHDVESRLVSETQATTKAECRKLLAKYLAYSKWKRRIKDFDFVPVFLIEHRQELDEDGSRVFVMV